MSENNNHYLVRSLDSNLKEIEWDLYNEIRKTFWLYDVKTPNHTLLSKNVLNVNDIATGVSRQLRWKYNETKR